MFHPRDATQPTMLATIARKLGLRREIHVFYLCGLITLFIFYMWYSTFTIFAPYAYHRMEIEPIELVKHDVPMQYQSVPHPRGLVMLFHGCSHSAMDWFTLPEERRIVKALLAAQFSVLAFNSVDRESGCWSDAIDVVDNKDIRAVSKGLREYLEHENRKLENTPLFALGASSGGTFVSFLCRIIPIHGGIIQVSPGHHASLKLPEAPQTHSIPPLTFIYMTRDTEWASKTAIDTIVEEMKQIHSNMIHPILLEAKPHPLTPHYLSDRIHTVTPKESARFYELAIKDHRWINEDGMLREDPRASSMMSEILGEMDHEDHQIRNSHKAIEEELNVLYGLHEMTSEFTDVWIPWITKLAEQVRK